jgi:formate hydrogenlyase subunit 3/multisubunit Na+/H+ antiporter MnhD subunit
MKPEILLLAVPAAPLLLLLAYPAGHKGLLERLTPLAALPALLISLLELPPEPTLVPWLLLGGWLGLDETGRLFLFFTSLLWLASGWYSRGYLVKDPLRAEFFLFYLLAMSGNFGVIMARDLITFIFFFSLMSFAAYGLVVHTRDAKALYAARLYMLLVILGELLLFAALLLVVTAAGTIRLDPVPGSIPAGFLTMALLLIGFGIKAGMLPVHIWLPLAHPAAPVPASAVLSGAMIKAGLLGWLRFLPLGETALPGWSDFCLLMGFGAVFYGALVGALQHDSKTVLAYSSISQMGLMTVGIGIGLANPEQWHIALTAVQIHAVHHGLAKGALFLGIGVASRTVAGPGLQVLVRIGLVLPALILAGAPFTSGMVAKTGLLQAAGHLASPWPALAASLLPLSSIATTLLMARFLTLIWSEVKGGVALNGSLWRPWLLLILAALASVWLLPAARPLIPDVLGMPGLTAGWPLLIGLTLAALVYRWRLAWKIQIPAGDLLLPMAWGGRKLRDLLARSWALLTLPLPVPELPVAGARRLSGRIEQALRNWLVVGTSCAAILLLLLFFLMIA